MTDKNKTNEPNNELSEATLTYHLLQLFSQSFVSDFQITKLSVRLNYCQQILQELILGFTYLVLRPVHTVRFFLIATAFFKSNHSLTVSLTSIQPILSIRKQLNSTSSVHSAFILVSDFSFKVHNPALYLRMIIIFAKSNIDHYQHGGHTIFTCVKNRVFHS